MLTALTWPGIAAIADARVLELVSCLAELSSAVRELFTALVCGAKLVFTAEIAVCPVLTTFLISDTSALGLLTFLTCPTAVLKLAMSEQYAGLLLPQPANKAAAVSAATAIAANRRRIADIVKDCLMPGPCQAPGHAASTKKGDKADAPDRTSLGINSVSKALTSFSGREPGVLTRDAAAVERSRR